MNTTRNIIKFTTLVVGTIAVSLLGAHVAQAAQAVGAGSVAVTIGTAVALVAGFGR